MKLSLKDELKDLPKISVVMPIKNEARYIARTIEQILSQDYPDDKKEILVICGQSEDNSTEIVAGIASRDSRVKLFPNPVGRSSGGRNIGVKNATGEVITFIDGHTFIDNNQLLRNTARLMTEKNVSVLSRPQFLEPPDNTLFQQAVALARKSAIGHGPDSTIYNDKEMYVNPTSSGASYKREVFEKVGYFDERFDVCEDVEFNYRVSKIWNKSFTSIELAVKYYPRETLAALFKQLKRYGIGRFLLARKHPGTLGIGTLIIALFTAGLPILIFLSFFRSLAFYALLGSAGLYLLSILFWSVAVAMRKGMKYLPLLPAIYPTIHFGLGWGFLGELWRTVTGRGISFKSQEKPN